MRTHFLIILVMFMAASGCAHAIKKEDIFSEARRIKAAAVLPAAPEPVPAVISKESFLSGQEKLVYKAKYLGISIGEFVFINKGKTTLNGRPAYCFELTVHTLPFFGKIKDRYVAYMDPDKFVVLRHEEYINKGERLESSVDFDYEKRTAVYTNVITGRTKQTAIPDNVQDIITGGYYLRMVPMALGDTVEINIYADEEIYNYLGLFYSKTDVKVQGQGKQEVYHFKSYLFQNAKLVKNISADVFLSTGEYRKPLRASLKTFLGSVSVVLNEE